MRERWWKSWRLYKDLPEISSHHGPPPKLTWSLTTNFWPFHGGCTLNSTDLQKADEKKVQLKPSKTQDPLQLPQCVTWRGTGIQSVRSLMTSLYHCVSLSLWSLRVLLSFKANLLILGVSSIGTRSNYNFPSSPCHTFNSMSLVRINSRVEICLISKICKISLQSATKIKNGLFLDFCDVSAN